MKLLTTKELSKYINVKEKTIYSWVGKGLIPYLKFNGVLRFNLVEIEQWVERSRMMPMQNKIPKIQSNDDKEINRVVKRIIESVKEQDYNSSKRGSQTNQAQKGV